MAPPHAQHLAVREAHAVAARARAEDAPAPPVEAPLRLEAPDLDGGAARGLLGLEELAVDVFEGSLTGKGALVDDLRGFALAARPLSIK